MSLQYRGYILNGILAVNDGVIEFQLERRGIAVSGLDGGDRLGRRGKRAVLPEPIVRICTVVDRFSGSASIGRRADLLSEGNRIRP